MWEIVINKRRTSLTKECTNYAVDGYIVPDLQIWSSYTRLFVWVWQRVDKQISLIVWYFEDRCQWKSSSTCSKIGSILTRPKNSQQTVDITRYFPPLLYFYLWQDHLLTYSILIHKLSKLGNWVFILAIVLSTGGHNSEMSKSINAC